MKRYLLDSNAAGDYVGKRGKVPERAREMRSRGRRIGICVPVFAELHYGIEYSDSRDENLLRLQVAVRTLKIWPFDQAAAIEYGRMRADLRRRGRPMPFFDVMIAAVAKTLGKTTIVSTDSDFQAIPGLDVEDWTK